MGEGLTKMEKSGFQNKDREKTTEENEKFIMKLEFRIPLLENENENRDRN